MKFFFLSVFFFLAGISAYSQNNGIGIGTTTPHQSAALEISDTSKGILIPRMTISQRLAIQNPAEGLMVYQTDSQKGYWYYDGSEWRNVANNNSVKNSEKSNQTLIYTTSGF